ncbi:MAG: YceI family protein [Acidobacteriota bacterium]|nr:YceI family protein [Acidobacteriota bacterium]
MKVRRALWIFLALPLFAAEHTLQLTPEGTKIDWTLSDVLHTVHGTFKLKRGAVHFDPETSKASGEVVVDVASGNSGSDARDKRMHANVLESAKYPEAVFTPNRVEGTIALSGASHVKVHGTFRIHGADHEMTMDAQLNASGDRMTATLTFSLPYVAWGMKDPSTFILKVSKSVDMRVEASGSLLGQ